MEGRYVADGLHRVSEAWQVEASLVFEGAFSAAGHAQWTPERGSVRRVYVLVWRGKESMMREGGAGVTSLVHGILQQGAVCGKTWVWASGMRISGAEAVRGGTLLNMSGSSDA